MSTHQPVPTARDSVLDQVRTHPRTEVLIIGGGINGLGLMRELAMQGVAVTLVERGDFVSGASAGSSHMVHGGIRYLENGEFRLVRESVQERNALIRLAPHCVSPQATTIPIYSTFSGLIAAPMKFLTGKKNTIGRERGAIVIKVGLALYDAYSKAGRTVPKHRFTSRRKALAELPALNPRVKFAATYYDAVMTSPERLALDVLADATAQGADVRALNYVEAIGLGADGVLVRDRQTGREFSIDAEVVVNATGPWTDLTNAALGSRTSYMGGTKGSHIVLDHPDLLAATGGRELFFEHKDGRIVLILPLGERVLVGTTDLEHRMGDPIVCTEDEVDYFADLGLDRVPWYRPGPQPDRVPLRRRAATPFPWRRDRGRGEPRLRRSKNGGMPDAGVAHSSAWSAESGPPSARLLRSSAAGSCWNSVARSASTHRLQLSAAAAATRTPRPHGPPGSRPTQMVSRAREPNSCWQGTAPLQAVISPRSPPAPTRRSRMHPTTRAPRFVTSSTPNPSAASTMCFCGAHHSRSRGEPRRGCSWSWLRSSGPHSAGTRGSAMNSWLPLAGSFATSTVWTWEDEVHRHAQKAATA